MTTLNGKTRYYCYNDGSGYNTTFFIDSAARLTLEEAEKEVLNFNNAFVALFAEEKKQRTVEAESAIKRLEEKKSKEEPVNNRYADLEQFWGKDKPSKHIVKVDPIEIKVKTEEKKNKQYNIDAISYEIKNIIKSLSKINEFLTK